MKLIVADNSMIELRIAAWLANEEHMQELFHAGVDLHQATAAYVSIALPKYNMPTAEFWPRRDEFMPLVTKEQRSRAKPVSFGFVFGQQPTGFIDYARTSYGITFTMEQAILAHKGFLLMYPALPFYFAEAKRWYERGWAITPLGRIRRHFLTPNEAINFPIQSVASDFLFLAMIQADQELREKALKAVIFAEVHDSLLLYSLESCAAEAGQIVIKHMERPQTEKLGLPFEDITVPLKADLHLLDYWVEECMGKGCGSHDTLTKATTKEGLKFLCEECLTNTKP